MRRYIVAVADFDNYTNHISYFEAENDLDAIRKALEIRFGSIVWTLDKEDIDHFCMDDRMIVNAVEVELT